MSTVYIAPSQVDLIDDVIELTEHFPATMLTTTPLRHGHRTPQL